MKRKNYLKICLSDDELRLISLQARRHSIKAGEYVRACLLKPAPNKDIMEACRNITRNYRLDHALDHARQQSYYLYLDQNALRRIINAARFSLYMVGHINMDEIKIIIRNTHAIYDELPEEIKRAKTLAMNELDRCLNPEYLKEKVRITPRQLDHAKTAYSSRVLSASIKNITERVNGAKT